jgi:ABC-type transport system involved in multi-copper enzyme maturation permease subunit
VSRLVAAELLKLRTKPSFWTLSGAALALLAAIHALNFALKDIEPGDDVALELSLTGVVGALMAVLGVMAVAGEHRDGSIRATYLWTPRRTRVLIAKSLAYGLAAALVGLAAALLTAAIVLPALAAQGIDRGIGDGRIVGILLGNVLDAVGSAEVGLALGALLRSQAAAITLVFAWALAVDPLLASAIDGYRQLSLGGAADALGGTPESQTGGDLPPVWGAVLVYVAWAGALLGAASWLTERRDVR